MPAEEDISLGLEDQNTGSDVDKDDETVVIIDDDEDKDWIDWNSFIYQGQTF